MKFNRDCKEFSGVYSCDTMKFENYKDCSNCKFYQPEGKKILIIKLGALGDVLRTTPVVEALREKYKDCHITWLVNEESKEILTNVDKVLVYNQETVLRLKQEKFYAMYNFEIDTPATLVANLIRAKKKYGYHFSKDGKTDYYNKGSQYYLERAWSDYLNKNNTKSYQQMMFEIAGLEWKRQDYHLKVKETDYVKDLKNKLNPSRKTIGINIGSSKRWIAKQWSKKKVEEFIKDVKKDYNVLILGGKQEEKEKKALVKKLKVLENDSDNSLKEFFEVVNLCDIIVTGDTMAMHAALALKKQVVALFFCTPFSEIEDYGRLKKLASPLLNDFFYTDEYDEELANSISVESVIKAVRELDNPLN